MLFLWSTIIPCIIFANVITAVVVYVQGKPGSQQGTQCHPYLLQHRWYLTLFFFLSYVVYSIDAIVVSCCLQF